MTASFRFSACLLFLSLAHVALPAERQATSPANIHVRDGFRVELLRSAQPDEGSWISMTFDDQGRIILGEDRAGLLRMTLGASPAETTLERLAGTEDLKHCRGVLFAFHALYVCATDGNGIYRLRDSDADGTFEEVQLLFPLDYRSRYGHGANQITQGPDGQLYVAIGNDVSFPEHCSVSPYQHHQNDWIIPNPHDAGQDGRVGFILRMDPDGGRRTVYAGGLRNHVDVAFNAAGDMFTWDADMEWDVGLPWYRPTRFHHVVSGGEYGWRWGTGKWPAWSPDSLPANVDSGLGSPTGLTFGTHSNWPGRFRTALYGADWQHGRLLMLDLTPHGASYRGQYSVFLEGSPLNVCDLTFGPDGALYFITGGRGSQSGLYRVTLIDPEAAMASLPAPLEAAPTESTAAAHQLRRQLETLHVLQDTQQLDLIWSQLGSSDRWLRFAARVALENQPIDSWRKRVATGLDSPAQHTALLALARVGAQADQKIVLKGIQKWDWSHSNTDELLWGLRTLQISLIRQGTLDEVARKTVLRKLATLPRQDTFSANRLQTELLVYLKAPNAIEQTLALLESSATQEEQIQYAQTLCRIDSGWNPQQREKMLTWLLQNRQLSGGKLVKSTLQMLRTDFSETLTTSEKVLLSESLAKLDEPVSEVQEELQPARAFVQAWTMQDLEADVSTLRPQDRSVDRGRAALAAAICLRCHRVGDRGGQIGPDLTAIGKRFDGRALLESILEPSKVIDPKYHNSQYQLADGRVVAGRAISVSREQISVETDALTGKFVTISRADILESRSSDVSPMPQGLLNTFSRDEILDLIAYLRSSSQERR